MVLERLLPTVMQQTSMSLLQRLARQTLGRVEWHGLQLGASLQAVQRPAGPTDATASECSTSGRFSTAPGAAAAARQQQWTQTARSQHGSLAVSYPFSIAYMVDREVVVHDLGRRPVGVDKLPGPVFNVPVRIDILHRNVRYLRAKWQQGTHKAKTRGEVSGGSRKPWPQKKTGQARQGSIRSPLWKGGATTFGPRPRSHAHKLPKNVQLLGMKCALSAKCNEGRMVVVDSLASLRGAPVHVKTMLPLLQTLVKGAGGRTALLVDSGERSDDGGRQLRTAAGMISGVEVMSAHELTVYHLLKYNVLLISKPALEALTSQLVNPRHRRRQPLRNAWWKREVQEFQKAAAELLLADG